MLPKMGNLGENEDRVSDKVPLPLVTADERGGALGLRPGVEPVRANGVNG